jgi:hypothetical protein
MNNYEKALYVIFCNVLVYSCSTNNENNTINNEETAMAAQYPPTNLTLTNISPTQIDLSWLHNSNNETGFKIERKGTDPYAISLWICCVNITTLRHQFNSQMSLMHTRCTLLMQMQSPVPIPMRLQ